MFVAKIDIGSELIKRVTQLSL